MTLLRSKRRNNEELKELLLLRRTITESGCWEWTGARHTGGYGLLRAGKPEGVRLAMVGVHRIAALLWLDIPLDTSLLILHRCDNPPCFNPDHLFTGTQSDNIQDAIRKGRPHLAYLRKTQTHCKHGHEYTAQNTLHKDRNRRGCRICGRIAAKRNKKKRA